MGSQLWTWNSAKILKRHLIGNPSPHALYLRKTLPFRALDLLFEKGYVVKGQFVALVRSGRKPIWRSTSTHSIQVNFRLFLAYLSDCFVFGVYLGSSSAFSNNGGFRRRTIC